MNIKAIYTQMGIIMGDFKESDGKFEIENPVQVAMQQGNKIALIPLLHAMKETSVTMNVSDVLFNSCFTPVDEIAEQYQQAFSKIVIPFTQLQTR